MRTNWNIWTTRPLLSQDRARRNAMHAAMVCRQRRAEREAAERALAELTLATGA